MPTVTTRRLAALALGLLTLPAARGQNLIVTLNPAGLDADSVLVIPPSLSAVQARLGNVAYYTSLESVAFDTLGNGYATLDVRGGNGALMMVAGLNTLSSRAIGDGNRVTAGPQTGLVAPKGLAVVRMRNLTVAGRPVATRRVVLVADFGARNVKAFDVLSAGDTPPVFTISNLGPPPATGTRSVWDVDYDAVDDRLFVACTDGVVLVYDNASQNPDTKGPARIITPTDAAVTVKISVNLHGIQYDRANNALFLSDVGSAASATDGQVFVVGGASTASGPTPVNYRNGGAGTRLGNPVDLVFDGRHLFVAEKANNLLLRFDFIYAQTSQNAAPNASVPSPGAESVALNAGNLFVAQNPAGLDNDQIAVFPRSLASVLPARTFGGVGSVASLENVAVGESGRAYLSFDGRFAGTSGVMGVTTPASRTGTGSLEVTNQFFVGPRTGISMPKGIAVNETRKLLVVADVGTNTIRVFRSDDGPNTAPTAVLPTGTTAAGGARGIWDVDYDVQNDRLYGAGTDGVVVVYDDFALNMNQAGPSRTFTPTDGTAKISVNLHGIQFVGGPEQLLLLTDVGSAASATDGQFFTVAGAHTASGNTPVRYRLAGAATMLGNPVDLTSDGTNVFIAEKSNDRILRINNVRARTGTQNVAADAMIAANKPEGIALAQPLVVISKPFQTGADGAAPAGAVTLGANEPNPFRASTAIRFALPAASHVRLEVFDALGRRVATLVDGPLEAGPHTRTWDGDAAGSGLYVVRLVADGQTFTRTMTRVR